MKSRYITATVSGGGAARSTEEELLAVGASASMETLKDDSDARGRSLTTKGTNHTPGPMLRSLRRLACRKERVNTRRTGSGDQSGAREQEPSAILGTPCRHARSIRHKMPAASWRRVRG